MQGTGQTLSLDRNGEPAEKVLNRADHRYREQGFFR
jgi:hypothetical protein